MAPPPKQSTSQPLPSREQTLFKKIVKSYEHKQYRNGLKFASKVLSNPKFAEHGETLAMKGLILNCLGKVDDAKEHVKRGLKNDLRSHVCWHVYGLLQRAEKKYDEAIKAYRNALKIDNDNLQILRDLSLLQIQMRDLEGYRDTRYRLLTLRPSQRANWLSYATAYHLLKDYDMSLNILTEYAKNSTPDNDSEQSELLLYTNLIMREAGKDQQAFEHLEENCALITDKLSYHEIKGDLLMRLNHMKEAAVIYRQLLDRNPENVAYYTALERCLGLDAAVGEGNCADRYELYRQMQEKHPRAAAPKRLPLLFLSGAHFLELLKPYLTSGLRKGVPALFQHLRPLYEDPAKSTAIEYLLLNYAKSLEERGKLLEECEDGTLVAEEAPTTILWVYYYLAQHYDLLGDTQKAHHFIDRALAHTPTLIELLIAKAKIHKHAGNLRMAVTYCEEAEQLDTADRFVNCKCAKYMLRASMVQDGERMCSKFTREGVNAMQNLNEMQCMWFETECANAYRRLNRLGDALKKCHEVDRHFTLIIEDQFDFHTYCIRKMTMVAYIGLLRLEDILRRHRFFYRAAKCAVKIYLRLHDQPYDPDAVTGVDTSKMNAGELKKLKRKKKKEQAKVAAEKAKQQEAQKKTKPDPDGENIAQQPLDPDDLVKTEKPLDDAVYFISPLIQLNSDQLGVYILGFGVFYRKGKILPMLQCLKRARELGDDNDPKVHVCTIQFLLYYSSHQLEDGAVKEILEEELPSILPVERDPRKLNQTYLDANENSLTHRFAVAQARGLIDSADQPAAMEWLASSLDDVHLSGYGWKSYKRFVKRLREGAFGAVDEATVDAFVSDFRQKLPDVTFFADVVADFSMPHVVEQDGDDCDHGFTQKHEQNGSSIEIES